MKYKTCLFIDTSIAPAYQLYAEWLEQRDNVTLISVNTIGMHNKNILVTYTE